MLDAERDGERPHPHPGHRRVADVDDVDAGVPEQPRRLDRPLDADRARRVDLDRDHVAALSERPSETRRRGRVASVGGAASGADRGRSVGRRGAAAAMAGAGSRDPVVDRRRASPRCARASSRSSRRRCARPPSSMSPTIGRSSRGRPRRRTGPRSAAAARRSAGSTPAGATPSRRARRGSRPARPRSSRRTRHRRAPPAPRAQPPASSRRRKARSSPNVSSADDRQVGGAARASSTAIARWSIEREGLEPEDVDTALEQALDLSPGTPRGPRLVEMRATSRVGRPERPHRAGDEHVAAGHVARLARELCAAPGQPAGLSARPCGARRTPVRPERRRLDDVGAGLQVLAVDRPDQLRPGRDELVEDGRCGMPRLNSSVPIAPSARSGPAASRSRKRARASPVASRRVPQVRARASAPPRRPACPCARA